MQLLDIDTSTITQLDFEYTPACEGQTHNESRHGHHAEEPASWVLVMPCCGAKLLICEPRRRHIVADGDILCSIHGLMVDTSTIIFTPIK